MSKTESPFNIANRVIIEADVDTNLSDLQNRHRPKKINPKKIGITPSKYLKTLGIAREIVANIVEYSLLYSKYLPTLI